MKRRKLLITSVLGLLPFKCFSQNKGAPAPEDRCTVTVWTPEGYQDSAVCCHRDFLDSKNDMQLASIYAESIREFAVLNNWEVKEIQVKFNNSSRKIVTDNKKAKIK